MPGIPSRRIIERTLLRLDHHHRSGLLLFAFLTALFVLILAPTEWNGNEENYFQLAYSKVAPEQFSQYHAIFDRSKARIVSEFILGSAVNWLGYESAHMLLRLIQALLTATGLALLFSALEMSVIETLLVVAVFCVMGEQLIAAESLFRGVEPKTLAYSMVFIAFGFACRQRWSAAIAFAAAATYLHFLVGGFWALMLLLFEWYRDRQLKGVLVRASALAVLVMPLLVTVIMYDGASLMPVTSPDGLTADIIYAEIRGAEHVAPFKALYAFWQWVPGIVVIVSLLGVLVGLQHRRLLSPLAAVPIAGLVYLLVALCVAFFDRHTDYLGKFYLFRPNSLILFFAITVIVQSIKKHISADGRWILVLVSTAFIVVFVANTAKAQIDVLRRAPAIPFERELITAIERHSDPDDIVLLEPFEEMNAEYERLHRLIARPTLVSWKFAPTNPSELFRWYDLIQQRQRLFESGCAVTMNPQPKLLVIFQRHVAEKMRGCGETVWQHGEAALIDVRRREGVAPTAPPVSNIRDRS